MPPNLAPCQRAVKTYLPCQHRYEVVHRRCRATVSCAGARSLPCKGPPLPRDVKSREVALDLKVAVAIRSALRSEGGSTITGSATSIWEVPHEGSAVLPRCCDRLRDVGCRPITGAGPARNP